MELDREDIRVIFLWEFLQKTTASECHRKICDIFGSDFSSLETVRNWYRKFKTGDMNLKDKPRSGRPSVVKDADIREAIDCDRHLTTRDLANGFGVAQSTICLALKRLNLSYKFNRWVPHSLTERNKHDRVTVCKDLQKMQAEHSFIDRMVTCDEKWVYYDNTGRTGSWCDVGQPPSEVARRGLTNKKVMLCLFWDKRGIVYKRYLNPGQTIESDVYMNMLRCVQDELVKTRTSWVTRKGVWFQQDNARPHKSAATLRLLSDLGWNLVPHAPYSPDKAPSDYYVFSHLQLHLKGAIMNSADEVKKEVDQFLESRTPYFWAKGIDKLPKRWAKIIEQNGNYYPH